MKTIPNVIPRKNIANILSIFIVFLLCSYLFLYFLIGLSEQEIRYTEFRFEYLG